MRHTGWLVLGLGLGLIAGDAAAGDSEAPPRRTHRDVEILLSEDAMPPQGSSLREHLERVRLRKKSISYQIPGGLNGHPAELRLQHRDGMDVGVGFKIRF
jgi:hypothetical protein